jgi:hypothetical protein
MPPPAGVGGSLAPAPGRASCGAPACSGQLGAQAGTGLGRTGLGTGLTPLPRAVTKQEDRRALVVVGAVIVGSAGVVREIVGK